MRKTKAPRLVEVEEGQLLSKSQFDDLFSHAKNSGVWYCTNYSKTSQQIREKLYAKGYPEGDVMLEKEEGPEAFNLVEETIAYLEDILLLDDYSYAERMARGKLGLKQGRNKVKFALLQKGIPLELVEKALDEVYADAGEELLTFVRKTWQQEAKRFDEQFKIKQKIMQKAMGRGWDLGEVIEAIDTYLEELEDAEED